MSQTTAHGDKVAASQIPCHSECSMITGRSDGFVRVGDAVGVGGRCRGSVDGLQLALLITAGLRVPRSEGGAAGWLVGDADCDGDRDSGEPLSLARPLAALPRPVTSPTSQSIDAAAGNLRQ